MTRQNLIDALREQAAYDAKAFRMKFPNAEPNERWIDNSFSAALPLAAASIDAQPVTADPQLYVEYKREIARQLGMRSVREDRETPSSEEKQMPTPGER